MTQPDVVLRGRGLTKRFNGVTALAGVDFAVRRGQVTGLLGANGAGKSTLVSCLSGIHRPDDGEVFVGGELQRFRSPHDARRRGIAVVHQEPQMLEAQDVAANIYLQGLARRGGLRWRNPSPKARAQEVLTRLGIDDLEADQDMRSIAGAQRQLVEIARALTDDPAVLILDEPNASLGEEDTRRLFTVVRRLRDQGVGVVLVSHRLREVYDICDLIVVMRDGRVVADGTVADLPLQRVVEHIMGARGSADDPAALTSDGLMAPEPTREDKGAVLELDQLSGVGFTDVSLSIAAGEIVGMAGLVGAGRTEIAHAVIGVTRATSGTIRLNGMPVRFRNPTAAVRAGVAFVPEGRREAVFYGQSVDFNIRAGTLGHRAGRQRERRSVAGRRVVDLIGRLAVKAADARVGAATLSGGNQQKLLFARALLSQPKLIILDEPTHGVDVGAKRDTYELIRRLAAEGMAVWLISSEADELHELADRTVVIHQGRVVADLPKGTPAEQIILRSFGAIQPEEAVRATA